MNYLDCFRALARRRTDQLVVTSAGNSSQAWWAATHDSEASFYLDASMSLSTMFASGLALARGLLHLHDHVAHAQGIDEGQRLG